MQNITSYKKIAKGVQLVGLILILMYFVTKNILISSLGITIGGIGQLIESFLGYKETGKIDMMKTIVFLITFAVGIYILFTI
ncbi:MAG: hypothetical protein RR942_12350 [Romboutsia sp.]